ncbi:putative HTH La-type RNA-binding protein [Lachnellula cervina]|uniref:Putative HTH La-type RNA-binding protein n=1 Tax=Lachnellula cervina TaxID=1316786 RepID=A0A7D8YMF6_9HELO|nr:putative HTH La-type RNA-binding protein [Lachnellula cervina]
MSSTTSRSAAEAAPAPPAFSYAQAAKSRVSSANASGAPSNHAASGISTPAKGTNTVTNTPSGGSERGDQSVNGSIETPNRAEQSGDGSNTESKVESSIKSVSRPVSPSLGTASTSTLPKEDDDFILVGGPNDVGRDKIPQDKPINEKNSEGNEGKKGKKGKKQKKDEKGAAEKEKEEVKPEVFVPAPLPTVNFWQKRKAEAAKKPAVVGQAPPAELPTSNDTGKSPDNKRRGKSTSVEESEKPVGFAQNGVAKDALSPSKSQKKNSEGSGKAKEDQSSKRSGARGSRASEEKSSASPLPPPVEDSMSWPTPETALEEEKRKVSEKVDKEDKDENGSNKPRPKEKWVPVPYVPSVAFNTPLPSRGGRGRGGARGGRTEAAGRSVHAAGDKAQNTAIGTPSGESEKHLSRGEASRAASLPPNSAKRQPNDQSGAKDQHKPSVATGTEKSKSGASKGESGVSTEFTANANGPDTNPDLSRGEHSRDFKSEQGVSLDSSGRNSADRRSETNARTYEQSKEGGSYGKDSNRERGDGRSERGRGGFRGARGHNNFQNGQQHPQHIFTNGHGAQPPNGYPVRSAGPYSPPLQPPPFSNQYAMPPSRGGRGGSSRSQSIPNGANIYGRYPSNGAPSSQHMPSLQTANPMYDYQPMQSMSATHFNPYVDHISVLSMVTMQLEYYFSIDNLCKDMFLRQHMDSQGFVLLSKVANFRRLQALTQEFELIRHACEQSDVIDLVRGDDNLDRVRRKEGWEKWVMAMEERHETAKNGGPAQVFRSHRSHQIGSMMMPGNHAMSPPPFSPNGTEFRPYGNGAPVVPVMNGNGNSYHPETPLSAAVPDFAPGLLPLNGTPDPLEVETTFSDEEVANLTLVFAQPKGSDESKPKLPFHHASSRTFSNGSIDTRSIAEEIDDNRQGRALTNGARATETSPDAIRRSRSPFTPLSPTKTAFGNGPPVMWVKGQRQQAPVSEQNSEESYTSFRARALKHRDASTPGETHADMKLLYEFWSHFLCRNFNLTMYNEFRSYAFEDSRLLALSGMKNLISYYDEILNSKKKVIPETLARHYVELVKSEDANDRPAFERLRAAWRNGALDMKSRKKIDNFVDQKLKEELERAPKQKSDSS